MRWNTFRALIVLFRSYASGHTPLPMDEHLNKPPDEGCVKPFPFVQRGGASPRGPVGSDGTTERDTRYSE
jgi:hypothetical protein